MAKPEQEVDIKKLRTKLRMTQEEFANVLGCRVTKISRWENGHSKPSKTSMRLIALLFRTKK
jgi:DNA-binding transcriptional regulator YiaG